MSNSIITKNHPILVVNPEPESVRRITLQPETQADLLQLAQILFHLADQPDPHFDMENFIHIPSLTKKQNLMLRPDEAAPMFRQHLEPNCGSVACALGHAAVHKIGFDRANAVPHQNLLMLWGNYAELFTDGQEIVETWLFDYEWRHHDNTPRGAALRIYFLLQHGVPKEFDTPYQYNYSVYVPLYRTWTRNEVVPENEISLSPKPNET